MPGSRAATSSARTAEVRARHARGERNGGEAVAARIKALDAALAKGRLSEDAVLYRGISGDGARKLLSQRLRKGEVIDDHGFMSTSRSQSVARDFANQARDNIVLSIKAKAGANALDIAHISDMGEAERKVLFPRGSQAESAIIRPQGPSLAYGGCRWRMILKKRRKRLRPNGMTTPASSPRLALSKLIIPDASESLLILVSRKRTALDRAAGCLLGLAVGDAVGTTLEFRKRDTYEPLTDMAGGGPFQLPAGTWTDDTAMALALADSLHEMGGLDERDLMRRFTSWWLDGDYSPTGECFDIGATTAEALDRFRRTGDPVAGSTDAWSAGNGSLMRLAPIAIRGGDTMRADARRQSATTHAAVACLDACEGYALILRAAIDGAAFDDAAAVANGMGAEPIRSILSGGWRGKTRDDIASSGYVAHSLEAALWCVGATGNYRDAVLLAANLGDDADTTAAITGQLAGALYGASGIPSEWLNKLAWRDRLERTALELAA